MPTPFDVESACLHTLRGRVIFRSTRKSALTRDSMDNRQIEALKMVGDLQRDGVSLWVKDGELNWNAPEGVMTLERAEALRRLGDAVTDIANRLNAENRQPIDLVPQPRTGFAPLSFGQERLWFLDQWGLMGSAYNIPPAIYCLKGELNQDALRRSVQEIVHRHEILRTRFTSPNGVPIQIVDGPEIFQLTSYDLSTYSESDQASEVYRLARSDADHNYDLATGPLFKVSLLRLGRCEHLLTFSAHHIVSDGWSQDIIIHEFVSLYEAFASGQASPLQDVPIQYVDFAIWQRAQNLTSHLAYWVSTIAGYQENLALPYDRERPRRRSWRAETVVHQFSGSFARDIAKFSATHQLTPFMTFLSGLFIVLNRYAGRSDLCIGTSIAGRDHSHLEGLVGFFMNVLPLRIDLSGDPSGEEILRRVRNKSIEALEHRALPFEHLLSALKVERDQSQVPLIPIIARHQNWSTRMGISRKVAGVEVYRYRLLDAPDIEFPQMAKCELDFVLYGTGANLQVSVEYAADMFERSTIVRWMEHCENVLRELIANPALPISHIKLSGSGKVDGRPFSERTALPYTSQETLNVVELFERQARTSPTAIACIQDEHLVSYAELSSQVNQVTNALLECNVGSEELVGICLERSTSFLASLIGVLKSGCAYVPLDPAYPPAYLRQILADARPRLIITTAKLTHLLPSGSKVLDLESIATQPITCVARSIHPDQLAYVTHTSGSTGKPKGVMVPHRQILNWLFAMWDRSPFVSGEAVAQKTPANFVVSLKEMLGGLLKGIPVIFLSDPIVKDMNRLISTLERWRVTRLNIVPSHLSALVDGMEVLSCGALRSLRYLITAGESLTQSLKERVQKLMPWVEIWNNYGCTELNDVSYCGPKDQKDVGNFVPIGLPIPTTSIYILDAELRRVPEGVIGELYVESSGAARGYLGKPALTAERFIAHPYSDNPGMRLYRTGDLARVEMDGKLHYMGRKDFEVKIRGHRIDVRHVEQTLLGYPGIDQTVVHAASVGKGDAQLVAYYVCEPPAAPSPNNLRDYLSSELPDYMVPVFFVPLDALPRLPNGKLNRNALPIPDPATYLEETYQAPEGEIELLLALTWQEHLNVERIGRHDNFFSLGGHSLLGIRILQHVNDALRISLPVYRFFDAPTIAGMAQYVIQAMRDVSPKDSEHEC